MAKEVATLVRSAQGDSALRQELIQFPDQFARDRGLSVIVTRAAARALGITAIGLAVFGIWF